VESTDLPDVKKILIFAFVFRDVSNTYFGDAKDTTVSLYLPIRLEDISERKKKYADFSRVEHMLIQHIYQMFKRSYLFSVFRDVSKTYFGDPLKSIVSFLYA